MKSLNNSQCVSNSPTPSGRRARTPCRAAAGAGIPGGCIPLGGEAWFLPDPASGPCSPAGPPGVPAGRSGTGSPGDNPLSPEGEAGEGSWAGRPVRAACRGAGACWGPAGQGDKEEAAWSDGRGH